MAEKPDDDRTSGGDARRDEQGRASRGPGRGSSGDRAGGGAGHSGRGGAGDGSGRSSDGGARRWNGDSKSGGAGRDGGRQYGGRSAGRPSEGSGRSRDNRPGDRPRYASGPRDFESRRGSQGRQSGRGQSGGARYGSGDGGKRGNYLGGDGQRPGSGRFRSSDGPTGSSRQNARGDGAPRYGGGRSDSSSDGRSFRGDSVRRNDDRPRRSDERRPRRDNDGWQRRDGERPTGRDGGRPTGRDGGRPTGRDGGRPTGRDGGRPAHRDAQRPQQHGANRARFGDGSRHQGARFGEAARDEYEDRDPFGTRSVRPQHDDPDIPEGVQAKDLDRSARAELKTLSKDNADWVAKHLVAAALFVESDPARAQRHAVSAARRAGRIAVVRETLAITSYQTGDFASALRELRTYRRISGRNDQLPMMVDCERGLGRPERALELGRSVDRATLDIPVQVELAIAMSGARIDLGNSAAALRELEIPQLDPTTAYSWSPSLYSAYAATLEELGRQADADIWWGRVDRATAALADASDEEAWETVDVVEETFEVQPDEDRADEPTATSQLDAAASDGHDDTVSDPIDSDHGDSDEGAAPASR